MKKYKIQIWVLQYIDYTWEDIESELGEDIADAICMLWEGNNPKTMEDVQNHLNEEWFESWDGTVEQFITYLLKNNIIMEVDL